MSDPLLDQIMEAFGIPAELRDWVVTPDPWTLKSERYRASLPQRMDDAAAAVNARYADVLPEGMRFGWR